MNVDRAPSDARRRNMARIGNKNTKPELAIRSILHQKGFRFRLHSTLLPGKPDLVFPKYRAVMFVHGCFWHGHGCHLFKWPKTREYFWREKINSNIERDRKRSSELLDAGWRVATIWECALKGRSRLPLAMVGETCANWLRSNEAELGLSGDETRRTV